MRMENEKKMKILCLHGFRTSGSFLQKQISKWDPSILAHFDLDFPNGIFPAGGKSDIEGIFPPPYFEWFQYNQDFTEYTNLEECISYLCEYITTKGPFDGLLGFSQGATISALLLGYQLQGKVLKEHPPMKLFISISGAKFRDPSICQIAYKDIMKIKSVHFIGAKDWLRLPSEELATAFDSPLIIRHPQGHTVPRLDQAAIEQLRCWVAEILQCHNKDLIEKLKNGEEAKMDAKKVQEKTDENEKLKNGEAAKLDAKIVQEKTDENEKLKNGEAAKMDAKKVQEKTDENEKPKNEEAAKMDAKKVQEKTDENEKLKNGEAAKMDAKKVQEKPDENEKLKNGEAAKMDAKKVQEKPDEIEKQAEAE